MGAGMKAVVNPTSEDSAPKMDIRAKFLEVKNRSFISMSSWSYFWVRITDIPFPSKM